MLDLSVKEYINKLASTDTTPSGGSTVGVISSLATSLSLMACNVSFISDKNEALKGHEKEVKANIKKLEKLSSEFEKLAEKDAKVFDNYMSADKKDKKKMMMECLSVPFDVSRKCVEAIDVMDLLTPYVVSSIVSDMMLGFILTKACFESSLINVDINDKWIKDKKVSADIKAFKKINVKHVNKLVKKNLHILGGMM